jgi:hypothetical protein
MRSRQSLSRVKGTHVPFSDDTPAALYGGHVGYVSRVAKVTEDNLRAGYLVVEDAEATVREAAQSNVGKR